MRSGVACSVITVLTATALLLASPCDLQARERFAPPPPSTEPWLSPTAAQQLQSAIEIYRNIVASGGWPRLPDRITLRLGDSGDDIATLRRRLAISGELRASSQDGYGFDQEVEAAVKAFQMRNGVEPTGVVYGLTQRLLNVPAQTRLNQLEMNLVRLNELLAKTAASRRYIVMNAASFELQGVEDGQVRVTSRTISGKRTTPTPTVSAQVQAINLLPYWHVPGTIAKAALIPTIRKDPAYLMKEQIRVFSAFGGEEIDPSLVNWWGPEAERYVFRQDPGQHNALGVLRFDMPNKHIVYMHDTPMKQLFFSFERAFSAGCVRLESFLDVATWVLQGNDGWTRERITQAIAAGERPTLRVPQPVPVHFIYLTAWVDRGAISFRNDLYNRDNQAFQQDAPQQTVAPAANIAP